MIWVSFSYPWQDEITGWLIRRSQNWALQHVSQHFSTFLLSQPQYSKICPKKVQNIEKKKVNSIFKQDIQLWCHWNGFLEYINMQSEKVLDSSGVQNWINVFLRVFAIFLTSYYGFSKLGLAKCKSWKRLVCSALRAPDE